METFSSPLSVASVALDTIGIRLVSWTLAGAAQHHRRTRWSSMSEFLVPESRDGVDTKIAWKWPRRLRGMLFERLTDIHVLTVNVGRVDRADLQYLSIRGMIEIATLGSK
jgi:hypothetical protein